MTLSSDSAESFFLSPTRVGRMIRITFHPWQETLLRGQSTHKHTHMRKLIAASAAYGPSSQKSDQTIYLDALVVP